MSAAFNAGPCTLCARPIVGHDYYRDREPGDLGGDNYHHSCWEVVAARRAAAGVRPSQDADEGPRPCIALSAEEVAALLEEGKACGAEVAARVRRMRPPDPSIRALSHVESMNLVCNRVIDLTEERDEAREKLRALVEATDELDRAAAAWSDDIPSDEALDAAKDRHESALAAARGAL